ncbi:MAG: hypothetical protein J6P82_00440, partial [Bacteroidales bacterium]|nr:hypothetical protein [Bacteroidales bacterium]
MKKLISSILFLASFAALSAQVEQTVIVQEYNESSKKTPLSQVGVTVMNAGAAISDENGQATLRFRTLHAGDKVTIRRIEKAGYEIFNSQAIEQWTISPQQPFRIVLCRSDRFKALRDEYNRVASDSYARQYKAEQARLAEERKRTNMLEETYKQKLLDLENQYQQQLEDLDNYVDQFARIDLSELSIRQAKLIRMVKEGKIDEAIITAAAKRIVLCKFQLGVFENPYVDVEYAIQFVGNDEHTALNLEAARKSMTLLKNDGILPLAQNEERTILVVGPRAGDMDSLVGGWSSSQEGLTIAEAVAEYAGEKTTVLYVADDLEQITEAAKE